MEMLQEQFLRLTNIVETDGEAGFWKFAPLLKEIADTRSFVDILNTALSGVVSSGKLNDLRVTGGGYIILAQKGPLALLLIRNARVPKTLLLDPLHSLQILLDDRPLSYSRYSVDGSFDPSVFSEDVGLKLDSRKRLDNGEVVSKDARSEIVDYLFDSDQPASMLRLTYGPIGAYEWEFDRESLKAVSISMNDPANNSIYALCELLAEIGFEGSIDHLIPLLSHEGYEIRWRAIQAIGKINPQMGVSLIEKALEDPHPHVRTAATHTLAGLQVQTEAL
jgi:hypothetical protein